MPHDIRSAWFKTLGQLALILALAVVVGLLVGQIWPVVTVAALGVVAWHYWRLRKVLLRLTARQRLEPAQGRGVWNELDRLLFRGQAEMRTRNGKCNTGPGLRRDDVSGAAGLFPIPARVGRSGFTSEVRTCRHPHIAAEKR